METSASLYFSVDSFWSSCDQFKPRWYLYVLGKALSRLSEVTPVSPLKQFQCWEGNDVLHNYDASLEKKYINYFLVFISEEIFVGYVMFLLHVVSREENNATCSS